MRKQEEPEVIDDIEAVDDETFTDSTIEEIEDLQQDKLKDLRKKLAECESEKITSLEELQRTKADFLNAKKRLQDEQVRAKEREVEKLIEKLLPLCDSFSIAMSDQTTWNAVDDVWRKGVEGIHNQLQSILTSYNVSPVSPDGQMFNPTTHDAMANVPVDSKELHGAIISVVQPGYVRTIEDRVHIIRPARVTVGEYNN